MAKLYGVSIPTINEHLSNIFKTEELNENSVIRNFRITAADGKEYNTNFYNLDAIISVGYRVNSKQAVEFRKWATEVLKQFAVQGYVLDKERRRKMSKNKICIACGFEDFEENINNFCCNCGKDIDTGLTLEEMDKQGINYLIDKRTNEYRNDITKHNDLVEFRNKLTNDTDCVILEEDCQLLDRVLDDLEQKNQRIEELEKEKQTAVKEFADAIIKMLNKYSIKGTIKICDNVIENNIHLILKERGIE